VPISLAHRPHTNSATSSLLACAAILLLAPASALAGGPKYVAGVSFFNPASSASPFTGPAARSTTTSIRARSTHGHQPAGHGHGRRGSRSLVRRSHRRRHPHRHGSAQRRRQRRQHRRQLHGHQRQTTQAGHHPARRRHARRHHYPLGVIYDADGSVIDALFGAGAAKPTSCQNNGVWSGSTTSTPTPPSPTPSSCSTASAPPTPTCSP
jgi:hypothetical protein